MFMPAYCVDILLADLSMIFCIGFEALHGEVSMYWFAVTPCGQFSKNKLYLASRYTRGNTANQIYMIF